MCRLESRSWKVRLGPQSYSICVINADFALRRCQCQVDLSSPERIFFLHLHSSLKTQLLIWSALKTMAVHSTASSELQVELLPRLSRNHSRCCEKGLSAPGVRFSNFETSYLVFSNTRTTKRLGRWSFWYDKWFCSLKNLCRVLPSLRSNDKVGFGSSGGVRDLCRILACAEEWLQTDSVVVLCFSDWFFFPSEVRTKDFWSTFYV